MDIDSHCPYPIFGETTSHLTSKWGGTFKYFQFFAFNVDKETRSPEISRQQVQKLTPQFFFYIGYRFPLFLSIIVLLKKKMYSQNYFFLEMLEIA